MNKRLQPHERRKSIISAALELAKAKGYDRITCDDVARQADVSASLVRKYFATMPQLRRAVMRAAVAGEVLEVIAQGLAAGDDQARKANDELKRRAVARIVE